MFTYLRALTLRRTRLWAAARFMSYGAVREMPGMPRCNNASVNALPGCLPIPIISGTYARDIDIQCLTIVAKPF